MRRTRWRRGSETIWFSLLLVGAAVACSSTDECDGPGGLCIDAPTGAGGAAGTTASASGGSSSADGGTTATGGGANSGAAGIGGDESTTLTGGTSSGGTSSGGTSSGGTSSGGTLNLGGDGGTAGSVTCTPPLDLEAVCPAAAGAGGENPGWCLEGAGGNGGAPGVAGAGGAWSAGGANSGPLVRTMIDDFEDGDHTTLPVLGGKGNWFTTNDAKPGGMQYPPPDPCTVPTNLAGERAGSTFSLLTYGCGHGPPDASYWGANIQVGLFSGAACDEPFDASDQQGVTFWARGSGPIFFAIGSSATTPVEFGGTCVADCWNAHGKMLSLSGTWTEYTVPFSELLQSPGWGTQVGALDPSTILTIGWQSADPSFEYAIDDVAFYKY